MRELPPLAKWPVEAFVDEPAHGFFQRIAAENQVVSTRGLATDHGLNARNPNPSELLAFCMRFPFRGSEQLQAATPLLEDGYAFIAGQKFRGFRDWSLTYPRVCPGCISEAAYHRTWFDLASFDECPLHGVRMVDGDGNERLNWGHPAVGVVAKSARSLAVALPRIAPPLTWERYVLGRLGFMEPWSIPLLDDVDLCHVIDVADILGFAAEFGWQQKSTQRMGVCYERRRRTIKRGFEFLAKGRAGIEECLTVYLARAEVLPDAGRVSHIIQAFYGWLYFAVQKLPANKCSELLISTMETVAADRRVYSRKGRRAAAAGITTLNRLARELGLGKYALRNVAVGLGLTTKRASRNEAHYFDARAVQSIKDLLGDLVSRAEAADIVGGEPILGGLCALGKLEPFIRLGGGTVNFDQFRRSELDRLMRAELAPLRQGSVVRA